MNYSVKKLKILNACTNRFFFFLQLRSIPHRYTKGVASCPAPPSIFFRGTSVAPPPTKTCTFFNYDEPHLPQRSPHHTEMSGGLCPDIPRHFSTGDGGGARLPTDVPSLPILCYSPLVKSCTCLSQCLDQNLKIYRPHQKSRHCS